ncbi:hypothetical protein C8Q74DRAFT_1367130 [Fomes fomentarius]|nr:hypothetical protein C8Q74DRAFT_1367130 [Fomes fomentarius]
MSLHRGYMSPTHTIKVASHEQTAGCLFPTEVGITDLYGRKLTFIISCVLMVTFALGCGFAQRARALHVPGRLLTVFANIPYEITLDILRACRSGPPWQSQLQHPRADVHLGSGFVTFAAGAPVGTAIGNVIRGILTQLHRRDEGEIPVPGWAELAVYDWQLLLHPPYALADKWVDWLGVLLSSPNGWKTGYIIALLMIGVFLVVLFILWERFLENIYSSADPDNLSRQR